MSDRDYPRVRCDQFREAASAWLDREETGVPIPRLQAHELTCSACHQWLLSARLCQSLVQEYRQDLLRPELAGTILQATSTGVRRRRVGLALRSALVLISLVQLTLALPAVFGQDLDLPGTLYQSHESGAAELAVGIALLSVAIRPGRVVGALTALAPLSVVLLILCAHDLADGAIGLARVSTHSALFIGTALLGLLRRHQRYDHDGGRARPGRRRDSSDLAKAA